MLNKKHVIILFLMILGLVMISSASAADSSDDLVNASLDEVEIDAAAADEDVIEAVDINQEDEALEASNTGTFTELQNKINNAKKGSTVTLTKNYKYDESFGSESGIRITKTLTIDGKGHKISGEGNSALLIINKANNVVLKNIVFDNGFAYDSGCIGVYYSNNVKFSNCRFTYNVADYGGAVFLAYSDHSSFVDCRFSDNVAEYFGGAVLLAYSTGSSFDSCRFVGNLANYGGDVYSDYAGSSFKSCSFSENIANRDGGAVYQRYSSASFDSCRFVHNLAENEGGGAICSFQSVLNCVNTVFKSNVATTGGGDIYSRYGMTSLRDSSFYDSYAFGFGAAAGFDNDYAQITNCNFEKCDSYNDGGGAVYCLNSIANVESSKFKDCHAFWGGSICSLNSDLTVKNNTFYNSTAGYTGGSIYAIYGSIMVDSSTFTYSSAQQGGAMYIRSPHKINNITNNLFLYSSATLCPRVYVDEYYGEVPESGNVYEDVYFVLGNYTHDVNDGATKLSSYSNVLTYVLSNSGQCLNDMTFYDNLKSIFLSNLNVTAYEEDFHIFDECCPDNSTVLLNNGGSNVTYDAGHFYTEFLSFNRLEIYICNLKGVKLDYLQFAPSFSFWNDLSDIFCFSHGYSENERMVRPVSDGEKNITTSAKYPNNQGIWIFSNLDESYSYKINGTFSFNFTERDLCYNRGNIYELRNNVLPVPLFNPDYPDNPDISESYYFEDEYVTPVKDQGIGGNCWAFAGIATLEACLKKITGEEYDLSENNAKNLMAASSIYGLNIDSNAGGYDAMFMGYLASWLGPINEIYDIYNPLSSISQYAFSAFHIQDISFLSPRKNSTDNDEFKYAIKNYGAVAVIFNWTDVEQYAGFHAVSLVGWDDEYVGFDSLGNYAEGAWIFKNSWGDKWDDELSDAKDGFGYLSYEQDLSGEIAPYMHAYTFIFNDSDVGYQDIYQYDFAGFTDYLCTDGEVYYKNRFTAKTGEYLYAFSTYFENPTYFTYSVRINGRDITKTDDNETIINHISYSPAGYHTIPLGYNLTLNEGDEFEIIIRLVNEGTNYVPVCQADELYKLSYPSNVSFVSYNGEDWLDMYDLHQDTRFAYGGSRSDTCQVACIKAFTATWRAGSADDYYHPSNGSVHSEIYETLQIDYFPYDIGFDTILIIGVSGWNSANYENYENYLELNVNGQTHYLKLTNGYALFVLDNEQEYYECSARLRSNCYGSDTLMFDFINGEEEYSATFSELEEMIDAAEDGDTIFLDTNYYRDINFNKSSILINKSLTIRGEGHILNGMSKSGFFSICSGCSVTLMDIKFINGNSSEYGVISSKAPLTISGCEFTNNRASLGGAVYCEDYCLVRTTSFNNNSANTGGALYSRGDCYITRSQFSYNHADIGGAVYCEGVCNILWDEFANNYADFGGAIAGILNLSVSGSDFTYNLAWHAGGSIFSQNTLNVTDSRFKSNQNIEMICYDNRGNPDGLYLRNNTMESNYAAINYWGNGIPYGAPLHLVFANCSAVRGELADLCRIVNDDGNTFIIGYVNVELTGQNASLSLPLEYDSLLGGYLFNTSELDYGSYNLTGNVSSDLASYCSAADGILNVVKKSVITASALTKVYGKNDKLTVTLKDDNGIALANAYIDVKLNGKTVKIKTDSNGRASVAVNLAPKTYAAAISFSGNHDYSIATKSVKVTVKKAASKIAASKKTFKLKSKTKKYTIALRNNLGKAIKYAKVTIKVNGKTYTAKTNSKGKASFKITKLNRKGTFKATIKYAGNKYYRPVSKKVAITVKN